MGASKDSHALLHLCVCASHARPSSRQQPSTPHWAATLPTPKHRPPTPSSTRQTRLLVCSPLLPRCNTFSLGDYVPVLVGPTQVGWASHATVASLTPFLGSRMCRYTYLDPPPAAESTPAETLRPSPILAVELAPMASTVAERNEIVAELVNELVKDGVVPRASLRNEMQVGGHPHVHRALLETAYPRLVTPRSSLDMRSRPVAAAPHPRPLTGRPRLLGTSHWQQPLPPPHAATPPFHAGEPSLTLSPPFPPRRRSAPWTRGSSVPPVPPRCCCSSAPP